MHVHVIGISTQINKEALKKKKQVRAGEQDDNRPQDPCRLSCGKMRDILQMTHEHVSTVELGHAPVLREQRPDIEQRSQLRRQAHSDPKYTLRWFCGDHQPRSR